MEKVGTREVSIQIEIQRENPENHPPIYAWRRYQVRGGLIEIQPENPKNYPPCRLVANPDNDDAETIKRRLDLYKAAITGDWTAAEQIIGSHREEANSPITKLDETALHIATLAEKTEFVCKLVGKMDTTGLTRQNTKEDTALCLAAITGKKKLAYAMLQRMKELPALENGEKLATLRGRDGMLPLYLAVFSGHRKMVDYLYEETITYLQEQQNCRDSQLQEQQNCRDSRLQEHQNCRDSRLKAQQDLTDLLVALINAHMFDLASQIIKGAEDLATQKDRLGETALHAIAKNPDWLSKGCKHDQRRIVRELLQLIWDRVILQTEEGIIKVVGEDWRTIFVAVERGNLEFLRILIRSYPQLVTKTNKESQTIFHAAVVHRQEEIFSLMHQIGSFKREVVSSIDDEGNNMLHLAAQLAPSNRIEIVPGAALQLQRELLWFEEVKKVVGPRLADARNIIGKNPPKAPKELFIENHKDLIKKGEEWMRNTANSCILVAILVATVVFAAAYTLPGGNDQNTGYPKFLHEVSFKVFAVADGISLIFSASSVLTFLSVLTSTYALDDFLWSLPTKLLFGLATLFISIVAMMVAFGAAFYVYFKQPQLYLQYAMPVTAFALIPVFLFISFHHGIFFNLIKSACKYKCNSHFSPDCRHPLFADAEVGTPA